MQKESIGTKLRLERFKRNLTQAQVCKELGMKVSTLSQIENDNGNPRKSTLNKLIKFYKTTASQ